MRDIREVNDQAARAVADVKIMQKINHAYREAFREKFPGQVEHCLRLVMERLHAGLDKRDGVDIADPATWRLGTAEILDLTRAAESLHNINISCTITSVA